MINTKRIKLFITIFLVSWSIAFSQTQYEWRGPGRSGIYNETSLLKVWPSGGPALLWENSEVGNGYSSVTVTDDAIYITGRKGSNDVLTAFTQEGKQKWEVIYGKGSDSNYPYTRGTATISKNLIFLVSGMGDLVCINKDGKIIWSVNYSVDYDGVTPDFGISESPLVIGNMVIVTPGGSKAAMVAYDIKTGKVIWETASINDVTQYVNPLLVEFGGKKLIVTLSADFVFAVDSDNGKLQWKFNYMEECVGGDTRFTQINTPIFQDGYLLVANGYEKEAVKLKLKSDGSTPTIVWKNSDFDPLLGGMILIGDNLFGSTWQSHSFGKWLCLDWKTGKTEWINDWYNRGSIIAADGMIFIYEEKSGHIGLVKPDKEKLDVISDFKISKGNGPHWAHPVIDKGRLFVRHGNYLAVYKIK
jgi:outer membrane protein assembly factor BamB